MSNIAQGYATEMLNRMLLGQDLTQQQWDCIVEDFDHMYTEEQPNTPFGAWEEYMRRIGSRANLIEYSKGLVVQKERDSHS